MKTKLSFTKKTKGKKKSAAQISKTQTGKLQHIQKQKIFSMVKRPTDANYTIKRNQTQEPGNTPNTGNFDMNIMQESIKVSTEFKRTSINTIYNH